jgi:hypothetical protein
MINTPGTLWGVTTPEIACSATSLTCLVAYTYDGPDVQIIGQRFEVTGTGIAFLGDEFLFPMTGRWQQFTSVTWNSIDDNYLVTWQEETGIRNRYGIAFTHVYAQEQGPGLDELQHPATWLYRSMPTNRSCLDSRGAFNPQTDMFLVIFYCASSDLDEDPDLFIQRVSGIGTDLQGAPVRYQNIGDLLTSDAAFYDVWFLQAPEGEDHFMVGLATHTHSLVPQSKLFLFAIKGSYDPDSLDQLTGTITKLGEADNFLPRGISDQMSGRSVLAASDGRWSVSSDIYGYLIAPYIYIFPIISKGE